MKAAHNYSSQLLEVTQSTMEKERTLFAIRAFISMGLPYLLWLIALCIIAIQGSTRNNQSNYYFSQSINSGLYTQQFQNLPDMPSWYMWAQTDLLSYTSGLDWYEEGVRAPENSTSGIQLLGEWIFEMASLFCCVLCCMKKHPRWHNNYYTIFVNFKA